MLKVTLITVGKPKEKYLRDAVAEYEKRLSAFCTLKTVELEPVRLPDSPNSAQINAALTAEGAKILSAVPDGAFAVSMCIEGKQLDSVGLSQKIESVPMLGKSGICFIIGGSYGLSEQVKQRADLKLSMSKMTFPHQLARVMLLEQIYRSFKILQGGTYHK